MNWKPISTVLLFASIPAISLGCEQIDVPDAAMFRANLERTGEYADGGPRKLMELVWKFKTEGKVFSSPAVSSGVVYFGSLDNRLYAVDTKTGQEKWRFRTKGNGVNLTPNALKML